MNNFDIGALLQPKTFIHNISQEAASLGLTPSGIPPVELEP